MKRCTLLFYSLILTIQYINAQTLNGLIYDENYQPVSDVLVFELTSDSTRVLEMTLSDSTGYWKLSATQSGQVVKFEALGYQDMYMLSSLFTSADTLLKVILPFNQISMPVLEITDTRIGLVFSGDTLIYDVSAFSKNGDRSLRDVLTLMPGMSVDADGQIYYNNRKIDKLLLEGKDILRDQHRLVGESFLVDDVAKIQIIEQYKSFRDILSGRFSDQIAMNIVLKEEAKNTLKGDIDLLSGYKNKLIVKNNQYFIGKKISGNTFIRSDNTGQPVFTAIDFLGLQSSMARSLTQAQGDISSLLPQTFNRPADLINNHESVLSTSWNVSHAKRTTFNFSITGFYARRKSGNLFTKNYFQSANEMFGEENKTQKIPTLLSTANVHVKINENLRFEIDIPVEWGQIRTAENIFGRLDTSSFNNTVANTSQNFSIFPQLYLSGKIKPTWNFQIAQFYYTKKNLGNLHLQDANGLFTDSIYSLFQENHRTSRQLSTSFRLEKEIAKHNIGFHYEFTRSQEIFTITRYPFLSYIMEGRQSIADQIHETGIQYQYKTSQLWLSLAGSAKMITRDNDFTEQRDHLFFVFSAMARYNFSRFHYLLIRGKVDNSLPGMTTVRQIQEVMDGQTISSGEVPAGNTIASTNASLQYVLLKPNDHKRLQLHIEFNDIRNPVIAGSVSSDQYILMLYFKAQRSQFLLFNNFFEHKIGRNWFLNIKTTLTDQKQFLSTNQKFNLLNLGGQVSFVSKFQTAINAELVLGANNQSFTNRTSSNEFTSLQCAAKLIFQKNKVRMIQEVSYNHQHVVSLDLKTNFFKIHYTWEYSVKNNWTFIMQGIDVTNIQPMKITDGIFSNQYVGFKLFQRFPGSILVGVRKNFS